MKTLVADSLPKARTVDELREELEHIRTQANKDLRDLNSGRRTTMGILTRLSKWLRGKKA